MPELLDEIVDEAAALLNEVSQLRQQLGSVATITQTDLARINRHAGRIVNMLKALEVEHSL
jgi:hypothetical protein